MHIRIFGGIALLLQSIAKLLEKAAPESLCVSFVGSVVLASGQQVEQVVARVDWVPDDVCGSAEVARAGNVIRGWGRGDLLGCVNHSLQYSPTALG